MLIPLQPGRVTRQAEKHRLNVSQVAYSSFVSTAHRLLPRSSSRSTTAAITTTTAVTILLDQLRHRKSQQSPLPRGCEVPPRKSCPTLNRSGRSPTRVRRGWVLPHSIASVQGPQAEEHRGVSAASLRGQRCWINQHAQKRRCFQQY